MNAVPFIKMPLDLIASDAYRTAPINVFRFLNFLLAEHMRHGGRENGKLKATDRQLRDHGIGARHVAVAVKEAEMRGLIACNRRGMRIPTEYTITWLPLHDGSAPTDRWRQYKPSTCRDDNHA